MSIITFATVGYGDGYPSTHLGRGIMIITAFFGCFFVSLYIMTLNSLLRFSKQESKAFHQAKSITHQKSLKISAANIIKNSFLFKKTILNKAQPGYFRKVLSFYQSFRIKVLQFSEQKSMNVEKQLSPNDLIVYLEHRIVQDLSEIKQKFFDSGHLSKRMGILKANQLEMAKTIFEISENIAIIQENLCTIQETSKLAI